MMEERGEECGRERMVGGRGEDGGRERRGWW